MGLYIFFGWILQLQIHQYHVTRSTKLTGWCGTLESNRGNEKKVVYMLIYINELRDPYIGGVDSGSIEGGVEASNIRGDVFQRRVYRPQSLTQPSHTSSDIEITFSDQKSSREHIFRGDHNFYHRGLQNSEREMGIYQNNHTYTQIYRLTVLLSDCGGRWQFLGRSAGLYANQHDQIWPQQVQNVIHRS